MIKTKDPNMDNPSFKRFIPETKELIMALLNKNPEERIKAEDALKHPYFIKLGLA